MARGFGALRLDKLLFSLVYLDEQALLSHEVKINRSSYRGFLVQRLEKLKETYKYIELESQIALAAN